jgi:hypothetical protein
MFTKNQEISKKDLKKILLHFDEKFACRIVSNDTMASEVIIINEKNLRRFQDGS